jgi:D-sedoheptulose 7-phosphate isomerase
MTGDLFERELAEHLAVAEAVRGSLAAPFAAMRKVWLSTIQGGGKILFFGNGGSAGDAQHLATELTIRYSRDRKPIAAIALTTDSSALTAGGNDLGFERVFARQLEALGRKGDLAFGISTSAAAPTCWRPSPRRAAWGSRRRRSPGPVRIDWPTVAITSWPCLRP